MSALNKCMFIGNLGRDAEIKDTQAGTVATFSIACTEKWKDKSGTQKEQTEWVRCVLWGKRAEALAQYLTKGKQIYVEGSMRSSKYQGKDGTEKFKTEINVRDVQLLGGRGESSGGGQRDTGYSGGGAAPDDDDIPF